MRRTFITKACDGDKRRCNKTNSPVKRNQNESIKNQLKTSKDLRVAILLQIFEALWSLIIVVFVELKVNWHSMFHPLALAFRAAEDLPNHTRGSPQ
jgi:hypothetical protein